MEGESGGRVEGTGKGVKQRWVNATELYPWMLYVTMYVWMYVCRYGMPIVQNPSLGIDDRFALKAKS